MVFYVPNVNMFLKIERIYFLILGLVITIKILEREARDIRELELLFLGR